MSRLPAVRPRETLRILQRIGFVIDRQKGSHILLKKGSSRVTVPMHAHDLKRKTLASILEQAGLTTDQFLGLR